MISLKKRVSCLGVVGDQYKFPEKDFILTSNSTGQTYQTQYRRREEFELTGTPLTQRDKTIDHNLRNGLCEMRQDYNRKLFTGHVM